MVNSFAEIANTTTTTNTTTPKADSNTTKNTTTSNADSNTTKNATTPNADSNTTTEKNNTEPAEEEKEEFCSKKYLENLPLITLTTNHKSVCAFAKDKCPGDVVNWFGILFC